MLTLELVHVFDGTWDLGIALMSILIGGTDYLRISLNDFVSARLVLPAQTVDATPSNTLIRQRFPRRTDLFG
jgi:hypothetical protein